MRNEKLVQVEKAEAQINVLTGKEAGMRREFAADGIDAEEQKQLDAILGKIKKLKDAVKKSRAEVEANKRAWEGRNIEFRSVQLQIGDLRDWPDEQAPSLMQECLVIEQSTADERWKDASDGLDLTAARLAPIYVAYELQVTAKAEYTPLLDDAVLRIDIAIFADPVSDDISTHIRNVTDEMQSVGTADEANDYVTALATLKTILPELTKIEEELSTLAQQKTDFDAQWATLAPRLQDCGHCEFPDLAPMQEEIISLQDRIEGMVDIKDYGAALPLVSDLSSKVDTYLAEFAKAVDARTLYESRLPRIEGELAEASVCEFPALAQLQDQINQAGDAMKTAAADGDYEQALLEMDKLVPLLDEYRTQLENARLGQEFELFYLQLEPRFSDAAVCNYGPLEELSLEIDGDRAAAESAGSAGNYAEGIRILTGAVKKLDNYENKLAEIERAKIEYEGLLPGVLSQFDAIAQCEFKELDSLHETIIGLRDAMEALATVGDYVGAMLQIHVLVSHLGLAQTLLVELNGLRASYDTRLPGLMSRFDSLMLSDFAELEDERETLQQLRAAQEAAAAETDYRQAVVEMDAVERALNDLEAQLGNLIDVQNQYRETYNNIKSDLAVVEGCTHPELAVKKDPIIVTLDAMLAAAEATDFPTALEKVKALIAPVAEFLGLEELLKKYSSALTAIEGRLTTIRAYTYKSLEDDKKAIEDLYKLMTDHAAVAELIKATAEMAELETMVTAIIALNADLIKQEEVYKKLHGYLETEIEVVKKNTIEGAKDAAEKAVKAYGEMVKLGNEDEFPKAIVIADNLKLTLIPEYMKMVAKFGSEEEAYLVTKKMAEAAYKEAKKKSEEYPDGLKEEFDDLGDIRKAMLDAEMEKKFPDATASANSLIGAVKTFDVEWLKLTKREADFNGAAKTAIARFDSLSDEAEEKAGSEYSAAESLKTAMTEAGENKDFDEAEGKLADFIEKMDEIDELLKTQGEHQAEYEGLKNTLERRKEKAHDSEFKDRLSKEREAIEVAFHAMTDRADNEDYEGAVDKAEDVEDALDKFDAEEDKYEQNKVRFEERMSGLENQYNQAIAVENESLLPRVKGLPGKRKKAETLAKDHDYDAALKEAANLRSEVEDILAKAEKIEDGEAKEEPAEDDDGGLIDKVVDFVEDKVIEEVKDYVGHTVSTAVETAVNVGGAAKDLYDAGDALLDGDYDEAYDQLKEAGDEAWDAVKGIDDLRPGPDVIKKTMEKVEDVKKVVETGIDIVTDE